MPCPHVLARYSLYGCAYVCMHVWAWLWSRLHAQSEHEYIHVTTLSCTHCHARVALSCTRCHDCSDVSVHLKSCYHSCALEGHECAHARVRGNCLHVYIHECAWWRLEVHALVGVFTDHVYIHTCVGKITFMCIQVWAWSRLCVDTRMGHKHYNRIGLMKQILLPENHE